MTTLVAMEVKQAVVQSPVSFAWLEITLNCPLTCEHCYVASRPGLGHGKLSVSDWKRTMNGLHALGVRDIQFIGGEPTSHPDFCELVEYAAELGFCIEVYTNLVSITRRMWDSFTKYDVRLATSFYSADARIHDAITKRSGSHQKTSQNIRKAHALGLILRAGIIHVRDDQDILGTQAFLRQLGVAPERVGTDRVRGVGRGFELTEEDAISALCGKCASGLCVITAEGTVHPCIMARSFTLGNVLSQNIEDIVAGETFRAAVDELSAAFVARSGVGADNCFPDEPCQPRCAPSCEPDPNCRPKCFPPCQPKIA